MSKDNYDEYAQMLAQAQERRADRFHAITTRENERLSGHGSTSFVEVEEDLNGDRFTRDFEQGGQPVYLDDDEWQGEYDNDD
ncbi:hypothetical protein [Enterobacter mori]